MSLCVSCQKERHGIVRGMCTRCYNHAVRYRLIKTNDKLFAPGILYIMRGESRARLYEHITAPVYKIGVTSKTPWRRSKEIAYTSAFGKNCEPLWSFQVDNMRVVEQMFHYRYRTRRVTEKGEPEWFYIEDKLEGLSMCRGVYVNDALQNIGDTDDVYDWWFYLSVERRKAIIPDLWKHPLVKIELEQARRQNE
jgi:hypothetical protein